MSDKKIVMFSAVWCHKCDQAKPVFNTLAESNKDLQFEIIDVDENREMAQDFNITGVPTFVLIENDEEVKRLVGAANVTKITEYFLKD